MPNHVYNTLRVHGKKSKIKEFLHAVNGGKEKPIDANLIIPYPKKYADQDAKAEIHNEKVRRTGKGKWMSDGYNQGGYDWCLANWGTKWGMYDFGPMSSYQKSMLISFHSAWSPPLPIIKKMSKLFPELKFTLRYYEGGGGFKGVYQVKDDTVLENETYDYKGNRGG